MVFLVDKFSGCWATVQESLNGVLFMAQPCRLKSSSLQTCPAKGMRKTWKIVSTG